MECNVCGQVSPVMKQCSGCHSVKYCSIVCQKNAWPTHKKDCLRHRNPAATSKSDKPVSSICEYHVSYYDSNGMLHKELIPTELSELQADITVFVKAVGRKMSLPLNSAWPGELVMKLISAVSCIPLDGMKVVIKGKMHTAQSIAGALCDKCLIMVIGSAVESSEGLDNRDIQCLMSQLHIDRNKAVQALKKCGTVVDAIIDISSS